MRHKFLVLTVKKWLKSVYIYGSYRKIKTGVQLFLDHSVYADGVTANAGLENAARHHIAWVENAGVANTGLCENG